jgi:hypothetical protein
MGQLDTSSTALGRYPSLPPSPKVSITMCLAGVCDERSHPDTWSSAAHRLLADKSVPFSDECVLMAKLSTAPTYDAHVAVLEEIVRL